MGGAAVPLSASEVDPHLTQCPWAEAYLRTRPTKWHPDPSSLLATIYQRYRQTGQRSDSIERTVLQQV